ncbi:MAG: hypothetical protein QXN15_08220 [Candidatus Jordarchaeales archaeon]
MLFLSQEEHQEEQRSEVGGLATLLFLGFVCVIGYILESYWNGLFPFYINYANMVLLASPYGLMALCGLALVFLVLGALKAKYSRIVVVTFLIGGCVVLFLLWLVIFW